MHTIEKHILTVCYFYHNLLSLFCVFPNELQVLLSCPKVLRVLVCSLLKRACHVLLECVPNTCCQCVNKKNVLIEKNKIQTLFVVVVDGCCS